jgi:hypothetical protein
VAVISALSAHPPREGDPIFYPVGLRQKLCTVVVSVSDGVTSGCYFLVEGVSMMFLQFKVMDAIPPSQTAPLGGNVSSKLLLQCLVGHHVISCWCLNLLTSSAWLLLHGLALVVGSRPSALGGFC